MAKIETKQHPRTMMWRVVVDGMQAPGIPFQHKEEQAEALAMQLYPGERIITTDDKDHACHNNS